MQVAASRCAEPASVAEIYDRCIECGEDAENTGHLVIALDCYTRAIQHGEPSALISWSTMKTPARLARASILVRLGQSKEALTEYRRAEHGVDIMTNKQGEEYASIQEEMGRLAFEIGDYSAAVTHFSRAHDAYSRTLGWDNAATIRVRKRGAEATARLGK